MRELVYPPTISTGDRVAVVSPSGGLPELFPAVFEQGLRRLSEDFGLIPVEYPTTRVLHSSPADRARDLHAAFADPEIRAIFCAIGGDDQIKLLRYLDPELLRAHPKRFFGYSDATNIELFLWNLGIVSFYGGAIMVQFGMAGGMHEYTVESLRHALFEPGEVEIHPAPSYTDEDRDWGDSPQWALSPNMWPNPGWDWVNADRTIEGVTWGGCLEILDYQLRAGRYLPRDEDCDGAILLLKTSEELPDSMYVYRVLMGMGERGLLQRFAAVLVGRAKAWAIDRRQTPGEKAAYVREQRAAIQRALDEYSPGVPVVYNLDFGHTDPQWIVPLGGYVRIEGASRRIFARY
ncbi:MAG: S66 family peptidase [Ktedonobacterales bacterium]